MRCYGPFFHGSNGMIRSAAVKLGDHKCLGGTISWHGGGGGVLEDWHNKSNNNLDDVHRLDQCHSLFCWHTRLSFVFFSLFERHPRISRIGFHNKFTYFFNNAYLERLTLDCYMFYLK